MPKEKAPDLTGFKITKLPPGIARGADDLTKWAHNRAVGRFGVDDAKNVEKIFRCKRCKAEELVFVPGKLFVMPARACRSCGKWNTNVRLRKPKALRKP
jgi:hypothetical protein